MDDIFEIISKLRHRGEKAVLATIVSTHGSTPRKEGSKMLVLADGQIKGTIGGGRLEHEVYKESMKMLDGSASKLAHFELSNEDASKEGMTCGGVVDVFIEPIKPLSRVVIFGGGHISFFLTRLSKMVDFHVTVIDDRPEFANEKRFPEADEIIVDDMVSVKQRLDINDSTYIIIVTRGHQHDSSVLEWVVKTPAAYIGMIGSKKKIKTMYDDLKVNKGITQKQLDFVHSPVGLPIGAETPEEIAISIMAEIIQVYRNLNKIDPKSKFRM